MSRLRCCPLTPEEMQFIDEITPPGGGRKIWPA
jgi:hypothetical protein